MQQNINVVVPGRILSKQLVIESVRKPGQRMPVGLIKAGNRPLDRVPVQPGANVSVVGDVAVVVEIDERMMSDRVVERESRDHEKQPENEVTLLRRRKERLGGPADAHCCGRCQQMNLTTEGTEDTERYGNQSNCSRLELSDYFRVVDNPPGACRVKKRVCPGGGNDKNKTGRGARSVPHDSLGIEAGGSAVQHDQSRKCGRSSELCAELSPALSAEAHGSLGIGSGCTRLVAAGVLSRDPLQKTLPAVAVYGGVGTLRVRRPGHVERPGARRDRLVHPVPAQPELVCARRI